MQNSKNNLRRCLDSGRVTNTPYCDIVLTESSAPAGDLDTLLMLFLTLQAINQPQLTSTQRVSFK